MDYMGSYHIIEAPAFEGVAVFAARLLSRS